MWKHVVCWLLGHVPDLINIVDAIVKCERCGQPIGIADPKPVVTITPPPAPPKA